MWELNDGGVQYSLPALHGNIGSAFCLGTHFYLFYQERFLNVSNGHNVEQTSNNIRHRMFLRSFPVCQNYTEFFFKYKCSENSFEDYSLFMWAAKSFGAFFFGLFFIMYSSQVADVAIADVDVDVDTQIRDLIMSTNADSWFLSRYVCWAPYILDSR